MLRIEPRRLERLQRLLLEREPELLQQVARAVQQLLRRAYAVR